MPQTQNPWEIDYATPAAPQPRGNGSAQLEAALGPEPVIPLGRPAKPPAAAPAAAPAVPNPWEVDYEPPPQPGAHRVPGSIFAETSGLTLLRDLIGGASRDPVRAERSKQTLGAVVQGLAAEPGRWWGAMSRLGESMVQAGSDVVQGNFRKALSDVPGVAYHLAGAVPFVGPTTQQIGQDVAQGDYGAALERTGGLLLPMLIGPGATAAGRGTVTAGRFMRGAVPPAFKAAYARPWQSAVTFGAVAPFAGPKTATLAAGLVKVPTVFRAGMAGGRAAVAEATAAAAEEAAQRAAAATAAREAADVALAHQANVYEMGERIRQPFPNLELPPAQSTQMPPAGTYADEVRVQDLGPQPVAPEPPTPAAEAPAAPPALQYPDVTLESLARGFGKPLSRMNQTERAQLQSVYDRIQNPLPVEQPTAAERQIITPPEQATAELQYNAPTPSRATAQQVAEQLKAEMQQSGTLPAEPAPAAESPAPPTFEETGRAKKTDALFDVMTRNKIPLEMVQQFGDKEWEMLAKHAGVNPPSETTIQQLTQRLSDYEAAQNVPVTPGMSTESAQQAFQQARDIREYKPQTTTLDSGIWRNLQDAGDAALERMRKRGTFSGTRLHAMFPAEDVGDMGIWGTAKIANGVSDFGAWSQEMLQDAGAAAEKVRPQLAAIYADAQKRYEKQVAQTAGKLASTKELLRLYEKGEAGKDWYKYTQAELRHHFGGDAPLFVDFLAATSPNATVASNVSLALKAYQQYKTGQPFQGFMPAVIGNLENAVKGIPPGGPKVTSFKANLFGDPIAVTVDRWMARAMGMPKDSLTPAQYKFLDYQLTQIAHKAGVEPRQMQAAIWKAIKEEQGRAGNTAESFEQVLARNVNKSPELAGVLKALREQKANPQAPPQ